MEILIVGILVGVSLAFAVELAGYVKARKRLTWNLRDWINLYYEEWKKHDPEYAEKFKKYWDSKSDEEIKKGYDAYVKDAKSRGL